MQYKIDWIEHKEYEGRKYAKASITGLDGSKFEDISLGDKWGDKLSTFMPGMDIEGNTWQNPKNQKWSLYPVENRPKGNPAYKSQVMKEAMAKKEESIGKFQTNKEESIKVSSTMRDAVLLAVAEKGDGVMTADDMKERVIKWRYWLLENWEIDPKKLVDLTQPC